MTVSEYARFLLEMAILEHLELKKRSAHKHWSYRKPLKGKQIIERL